MCGATGAQHGGEDAGDNGEYHEDRDLAERQGEDESFARENSRDHVSEDNPDRDAEQAIVLARLVDVQRWSNLTGKATGISVAAKPGVSEGVLADR